MPVTALIDSPTDQAVIDAYKVAEEHFGHVPNLVKALATNPAMCTSITNFVAQALAEGRVSWSFKELVVLKTLRSTGAYYGYGAHEKLAEELGNSPERIGDIANSVWESSDQFTEGERAVFALVDQIAEDANDVGDDIWDALHAHWDHGQLLELTALVTTFIMIGRVGDSLGISDPELFTRPVA